MSYLNQLRGLSKWISKSIFNRRYSTSKSLPQDIISDSFYSNDHRAVQETLTKIIDKEINPYVDEWETKGEFPAHEVFKKLGTAGLLGLSKPKEYGGLALDFTYTIAMHEALSQIHCDGVTAAISVNGYIATPALTN
ncbi:hypothetical protein CHUAL_000773 [Chamberlinius hualienensis]